MPVGHASLAHPNHHEGATDLDLYRTFSPSDIGMWSWERPAGALVCRPRMVLLQESSWVLDPPSSSVAAPLRDVKPCQLSVPVGIGTWCLKQRPLSAGD